jgi:hypothetical protein
MAICRDTCKKVFCGCKMSGKTHERQSGCLGIYSGGGVVGAVYHVIAIKV